MDIFGSFDRRGRELRLKARPLLVLSRVWNTGSHHNKNKTQKPFTQITLQNQICAKTLPFLYRFFTEKRIDGCTSGVEITFDYF